MMVFHDSEIDPAQSASFEERYVDAQAEGLGQDAVAFWKAVKQAARKKAAQAK